MSPSRTRSALPRALAVLAGALLALAGCDRGEQKNGPLERILSSGEIRAGTTGDVPPLTMRDRNGELAGLEIDMVRALAGNMNVKLRFVEMPFAELIPALERGDIDLAVANMTITPERNARVAFAGPYFISGNTLLTRRKELADAEDAAQLDDPKLSFAALESSTSANFVREHMPNAKLVTKPDYDGAVQALLGGEVDGVIAGLPVCTLARWRHPDTELYTRYVPFTTEPLGIALPPNSALLLNLVTNYLNTLQETGELAQLKAKWLGDNAWLERLP